MKRFVPYEKMSKKEKRKADAAGRLDWGCVNPVPRRKESAKLYNRKRLKKEAFGRFFVPFLYHLSSVIPCV